MKNRSQWLQGYMQALGYNFKYRVGEAIVKGKQAVRVGLYLPDDVEMANPMGEITLVLHEKARFGDDAVMLQVAEAVKRQLVCQVVPARPAPIGPQFTLRLIGLLNAALGHEEVRTGPGGAPIAEARELLAYHLQKGKVQALDDTVPGYVAAPMLRWQQLLSGVKPEAAPEGETVGTPDEVVAERVGQVEEEANHEQALGLAIDAASEAAGIPLANDIELCADSAALLNPDPPASEPGENRIRLL